MPADAVILNHIQQHFTSFIQLLRENVDHDAARAYLKSLYTDASLDRLLREIRRSKGPLEYENSSAPRQTKEDIWTTLTCLNDDATAYTDDLGSSSPPVTDPGLSSLWASKSLEDVLQRTSRTNNLSSLRGSLSESDPEPSFVLPSSSSEKTPRTLCQACRCEKCMKAKTKRRKDNTKSTSNTSSSFTGGPSRKAC
jgi:hypothetical protein